MNSVISGMLSDATHKAIASPTSQTAACQNANHPAAAPAPERHIQCCTRPERRHDDLVADEQHQARRPERHVGRLLPVRNRPGVDERDHHAGRDEEQDEVHEAE